VFGFITGLHLHDQEFWRGAAPKVISVKGDTLRHCVLGYSSARLSIPSDDRACAWRCQRGLDRQSRHSLQRNLEIGAD
jgi:hypothetical protein